jgi:hypothetical protein
MISLPLYPMLSITSLDIFTILVKKLHSFKKVSWKNHFIIFHGTSSKDDRISVCSCLLLVSMICKSLSIHRYHKDPIADRLVWAVSSQSKVSSTASLPLLYAHFPTSVPCFQKSTGVFPHGSFI